MTPGTGSSSRSAPTRARGCSTGLNHRAATEVEVDDARAAVAAAADHMGRELPAGDLRTLLRDNRESPVWEEVADRCLTCGNCTMVCPTCFCTTTEDTTDLSGEHAERSQRWASCFELDFSYLHGGSVRVSGASRYRQWITHKLGTWHDQFGTSGCVGCGRCIAWCPVGHRHHRRGGTARRTPAEERHRCVSPRSSPGSRCSPSSPRRNWSGSPRSAREVTFESGRARSSRRAARPTAAG